MAKKNEAVSTNAEIAAAMRAFGDNPIELGFLGEVKFAKNDERAVLVNEPTWSKTITVVVGVIAGLLFFALNPRYGDPMEPFRSNLTMSWLVLAVLVAILIYQFQVSLKYSRRRENLFCKANGFVEVKDGTSLAGDLRKRGSIYKGYSLASAAGKAVCFGVVHGWFDLDHKVPKGYSRYGLSEEELRLFVSVEARHLESQLVYCSPDRPPVRDLLPAMSEQAFGALREVAAKYAVVVGEGAITVSAAGGSLNQATESMQFVDLSQEMAWRLFQTLLGKKLSVVVEGLGH